MTDWYTSATPDETDRLVAAWSDAPVENVELCGFLLDVAREQVITFAGPYPGLEPGDESHQAWELSPAPRLVYAQLMQAQNLWNAGRGNSNGEVGSDGYSFQPRPLDKTVRSIIRPTSGVADVF